MSEMKTLDARGLSCPQPALQTEQLLRKLTGAMVEVLVDSGTSRDNVARIARKTGWSVAVEKNPEGGYRLVLKR